VICDQQTLRSLPTPPLKVILAPAHNNNITPLTRVLPSLTNNALQALSGVQDYPLGRGEQ